jgi:peptidoglycan/xylan/chitin deacetylase (PgdA/CDA1 family)
MVSCTPRGTNLSSNNAGDAGAYVGNVPQASSTNQSNPTSDPYAAAGASLTPSERSYKNVLIRQYQHAVPTQWGENTTGVLTRMQTTDKVIALTLDACGGKGGSGYDAKLINYLIQQRVPATLFINDRWIDENYSTFMALAKNPLFEIEGHGHLHRPLSINGKSAWGITGTQNVGQVVDEVLVNVDKIQRLTGRRPIYFRSGTAFYDEYAVQIAEDLGVRCVNFSIVGDAGATYNGQQVVNSCLQAKPGSVILCHMNHPEKETAEGIMAVIPLLKQKGFRFVKLATYPLV